ncbi:hypothetical protein O3M35_013142 [Rhynocoris fuscipes]|uniref:Amino acid transporter transmembrane domain-containing protein n=1 Tax=Rhynocoris fuscipes TaxID=488301 RepID=A0AAW1CF19_9HEMI
MFKFDFVLFINNRYPYAALMELAYGPCAGRVVKIILGLAVFGSCVPNLILAAQNLQLIGLKLTTNQMDISFCYWVLILGTVCCPLMCIGTPKDLKWVGVMSAVSVFITSVLTWYCLIDTPSQPNITIPQPSIESTLIAYGILAFQFDVHPMLLTIQMDMKNKNDLGCAILIAFLISGFLFLITAIICYARFGIHLNYNTLQGLEPSAALYMNLIIVPTQIVLSVIVGISPLFQDLEETLNIPTGFGWKRCLLRTTVMLVAVILAETIPRFDLIMSLIGCSLLGQLMFIYPPLIYNKLRYLYSLKNTSTNYISFNYGTHSLESSFGANHERKKSNTYNLYPETISLLETGSYEHRRPQVGKFILNIFYLENVLYMAPISLKIKTLSHVLILMGISATIVSTCIVMTDIVENAEFTPPCIINSTLASKLLYNQM